MPSSSSTNNKDAFRIYREFQGSNLDVFELYDYYKKNPNPSVEKLKKLADSTKKETLNTPETDLRKDITLNINDLNKLEFYEDRVALARMIQNILVTKKGTYPNNPTFGVGIEDYLFDFANNTTKSELSSSITEQLNLWLDTKDDIHIEHNLQFVKTDNNAYTTLAIFFNVYSDTKSGDTELYKFTLFFTGDQKNRKIVSKLEF